MVLALAPDVVVEIEGQVAKVQSLIKQHRRVELSRLRDETAELQVMLAEAAREARLAGR